MRTTVKRFIQDEQGATAIEYALIAMFISITIVAGATVIGSKVSATFTNVSDKLQ